MRSAAELTNERRGAIHGRRARAQRSNELAAADLSGAAQGGVGRGLMVVGLIDRIDTAPPAPRERIGRESH
jgi:hypothetical protein